MFIKQNIVRLHIPRGVKRKEKVAHNKTKKQLKGKGELLKNASEE